MDQQTGSKQIKCLHKSREIGQIVYEVKQIADVVGNLLSIWVQLFQPMFIHLTDT